MDANEVRRWIADAEAELTQLAAEVERAQFRLADKRRQLMLLYEVLASLTHSPVAIPADKMALDRSTRTRVQADAERILRKYGKPMRIQDIHAEFIRNGLPLPGRGTPTNIAAHLVDPSRFCRFRRGVYGLAVWKDRAEGPEDTVHVEVMPKELHHQDEQAARNGEPASLQQRSNS